MTADHHDRETWKLYFEPCLLLKGLVDGNFGWNFYTFLYILLQPEAASKNASQTH